MDNDDNKQMENNKIIDPDNDDDNQNNNNHNHHQKQIPRCYCNMECTHKMITSKDNVLFCLNCWQYINKGNEMHLCGALRECEFRKTVGNFYMICSDCYKSLSVTAFSSVFDRINYSMNTVQNIIITKNIQTNCYLLFKFLYQFSKRMPQIINKYFNNTKLSVENKERLIERCNEIIDIFGNLIDDKHLNISDNQKADKNPQKMDDNKSDKKTNDDTALNINNIRNLWNELNDINNNDYSINAYLSSSIPCDNNNNINECKSILRMKYILNIHYNYYIKKLNDNKNVNESNKSFFYLFNQSFAGYNLVDLENDYIHILEHHHQIQNHSDNQNTKLYNKCLFDNHCLVHKSRYNDNDNNANNNNNIDIIEIIEIINKYHSYFYHNQNIERGLQRIQNINNKFSTIIDIKNKNNFSNNSYSYGIRFQYSEYFKNDDKYIKPAFDSFKNELLYNNIYSHSELR